MEELTTSQEDLVLDQIREPEYNDSNICEHCKNKFEYDELDMHDGSMICNECESYLMKKKEQDKCTHKDKFDNWTYEVEDDRCDTDRGTYGSRWIACAQCDADITEKISPYLEEEDPRW